MWKLTCVWAHLLVWKYLNVLTIRLRAQRRKHLDGYFTALSTNLPNWYERTAFEGLMITQLQPTLNKQLKYRKSNLIYTCISRINDPYEQIE